jgi:Short C-terminal domain
MITEIVLIIVIGTSFWVAYDAKANEITVNDNPYSINNGALAWFLSCIFIWIAGFPYYLVRRSTILRERAISAMIEIEAAKPFEKEEMSMVTADDLKELKELLDQGIVSQEEFDAKKAEYLNSAFIATKANSPAQRSISTITPKSKTGDQQTPFEFIFTLALIIFPLIGGIFLISHFYYEPIAKSPIFSVFGLNEMVTKTEYAQIYTGMSYQEVVKVIGHGGEEMSRNEIDGLGFMPPLSTIMYQWVNKSGSNMNAIFQNDKLVQKAQFGLQ